MIIQILLHGMNGSVSVADVIYQGQMPSFADFTDAEIAAVASHARAGFGNVAPPIEPETVAHHRLATADREGPWPGGQSLRDWLGGRDAE
jgi:hypothetical protein